MKEDGEQKHAHGEKKPRKKKKEKYPGVCHSRAREYNEHRTLEYIEKIAGS